MCLLVKFNSITAAEEPGLIDHREKKKESDAWRGKMEEDLFAYLLCSKAVRGLIDLVWDFICWINLIGPFSKPFC